MASKPFATDVATEAPRRRVGPPQSEVHILHFQERPRERNDA